MLPFLNLNFNTNIGLHLPFPGFTLFEDDQKRTFYVSLWQNVDTSENPRRHSGFELFCPTSTSGSWSVFRFRRKPTNQILKAISFPIASK